MSETALHRLASRVGLSRDWIDANRDDETLMFSEIQNLIDGAVDEIDGVLYKLRFLA